MEFHDEKSDCGVSNESRGIEIHLKKECNWNCRVAEFEMSIAAMGEALFNRDVRRHTGEKTEKHISPDWTRRRSSNRIKLRFQLYHHDCDVNGGWP